MKQSYQQKKKEVKKNQLAEELAAFEDGTTDALSQKRNDFFEAKVDAVFKKRKAKHLEKEEEKRSKADKAVQVQAPQSKAELAGEQFLQIAK